MFTEAIVAIYRQEVIGEPQLIEPDDFGLSSDDFNQQRYREFASRQDGTLLKRFGKGFRLVAYPDKKVVVLDDNRQMLLYSMRYKDASFRSRKFVAQSVLWAHPDVRGDSNPIGFLSRSSVAVWVFFDYLLKREGYDGIMSDTQQTAAGQAFWYRRIVTALDRHLYVYFVDKTTQDATPIRDHADLDRLKSAIWGNHKMFRDKLLVISRKELF